MKSFFKKKFLPLFLMVALILPAFAVFASADGSVTLLLRRTFDEGWDINNGFSAPSNTAIHKIYIDSELQDDLTYNYYIHYDYQSNGNGGNCYTQLTYDKMKKGALPDHSVLRFRIRPEAVMSTSGSVVQALVSTGGPGTSGEMKILTFGGGQTMLVMGQSLCTYTPGEWLTLTYDFDWAEEAEPTQEDLHTNGYCYRQNNGTLTVTAQNEDGETVGTKKIIGGLYRIPQLRIGDGTKRTVDEDLLLDDVTLFELNGTDTIPTAEEIAKLGYGSMVNGSAQKTIAVKSSAIDEKLVRSLNEYLSDSVLVKAGCDRYLVNNSEARAFRTDADGNAYGGPVYENGVMYLPLSFLLLQNGYSYRTYNGGSQIDASSGGASFVLIEGAGTAMVNGDVVTLPDAPIRKTYANGECELFVSYGAARLLFPDVGMSYSSMNVVLFAEDSDVIGRGDTMTIVSSLKKFLFDEPNGEQLYADVKANTNDFTHPYIFTNQDKFDELRAAYLATEGDATYDPVISGWTHSYVDWVAPSVKKLSDDDGKPKLLPGNRYDKNDIGLGCYSGFSCSKITEASYAADPGDNGYDLAGGRANYAANAVSVLPDIALTYQILRDDKLAIYAYYYMKGMAEWEHWGPDHFLNCADTTMYYAIAYDWLYQAWVDLGLDTTVIRDAIYEKGVYMGYLQCCTGSIPKEFKPVHHNQAGDFTVKTNNWNCVCCSGITIGCLAMMDDPNTTHKSNDLAILSRMIKYMPQYGMDEYVPDGSYVESATYWAYGTNSFFRMAMALAGAAGTDYGLMDCWGIDRTMDYACHVESADHMTLSYHDTNAVRNQNATPPSMDTSLFGWYGYFMGRPDLAALRFSQVDISTGVTYNDLLFYDASVMDKLSSLATEYYMEGIEGFVTRSSWEEGSLYAGFLGGPNQVSHGNIDSGAFVYYNKGKTWLIDLGSDDYNVTGYFSNANRFHYFRCGGEGQNNLIVTSKQDTIPYGQNMNGGGTITSYFSNEYGSYALLDNTSVYPGVITEGTSAMRGIFLTNDRKTFVVQDELSFSVASSIAWIGNYTTAKTVTISSDGRTAYMRDGDDVLRLTIVSGNSTLKFETMNDETYLLNATYTQPSDYGGNVVEYDRDCLRRLVIKGKGLTSLRLAVVMEMVESEESTEPVGYSWTPMAEWMPSADTAVAPEETTTTLDPDAAKYTTANHLSVMQKRLALRESVEHLRALEEANEFYGKFGEVAKWLSYADASFSSYPLDKLPDAMEEYKPDYERYHGVYVTVSGEMNAAAARADVLARSLIGIPASDKN